MSIELMTRVWKETTLRGTELLILLCLADHADQDGRCWPSYKTISARARTSPRWAMRCVKSLEAAGYLTRQRGNVGRSNTYWLTIPATGGGELNSPPLKMKNVKVVVPSSPTRAVEFTPPLLFNDTPGVVPSSHESSDEASLKRHESAAGAATVSIEMAFKHVLSVSSANQIVAVSLAERWLNEDTRLASADWKQSLTAWLTKLV